MKFDEYTRILREHGGAMVGALRGADLDGRVPSCPEWSIWDLSRHLGIHHRWVQSNLHRAPDEGMTPFDEVEGAPDGEAVVDWLGDGVEKLAAELEAVGPDLPCWTWAGEPVTGFWARRTTQETVIHGWDGRNALGASTPIDAAVAVDGIDEYLSVIPARFWGDRPSGDGDTIHVHCTDPEGDLAGEWLIVLADGEMRLTREHAKGDVAVRGPSSDLYLFLMGRGRSDAVEIFGDENLLARWQEWGKF